MKSIKILLPVAFLCISLATAYSQDATTDDSVDKSVSSDIQQDGAVTGTTGNDDTKTTADPGTSDKTGSTLNENSVKKQSEKNQVSGRKYAVNREQNVVTASTDEKTSTVQTGSSRGVLLQINEGNFKYKRIPDIKLPENQVQAAEKGGDNASAPADGSGNGGFLGMSKTASDILVYGGIILFIYLIFFLSRSRMKGSGGKKTNRKVLNSYRK